MDVLVYNSVMTSCTRGAQWQLVLVSLQQMQEQRLVADLINYNAVLCASRSNLGPWSNVEVQKKPEKKLLRKPKASRQGCQEDVP